MIVLGIESSCDDLAMCVLETPSKVLFHQVASQTQHTLYGGIVPELASREHLRTLSPLFSEVKKFLNQNKLKLEGIAVTSQPGLIGSLLVGVNFAKALSLGLNIPFVGVSHLEGHLMSVFLEKEFPQFPFLGMVLSGGHTHLYEVQALGKRRLVASTVDDAAGEAYDKFAKMLGLNYPGGPLLDRLAALGNAKAFPFKTAFVKRNPLDTSFSGLKTAALEIIEKRNWKNILKNENPENVPDVLDLIASFQACVIKSIQNMFVRAHKIFPKHPWVLSGGVSCNSGIRKNLKEISQKLKIPFYLSSPQWCTDNAGMIAYAGAQYLLQGLSSSIELNAKSNDDSCIEN